MAKRSTSGTVPIAKPIGRPVPDSYAGADISHEMGLMDLAGDERHAAGRRIHRAVQRLKELGIIDDKGHLVNPDLPADMQTGAKSTLG